MKIGGNHLELRSNGRAVARRIVEKSNAANSLPQESVHQPPSSAVRMERRRASAASRFETQYAGAMDRRGIESRFVAQVLGQILGSTGDSALRADRAYARSSRPRKETRLVRVL